MLRSIEHCQNVLNRIDYDMACLALEKEQILQTIAFLEANPPPPSPKREITRGYTRQDEIYEIIKEYPGIDGRGVHRAIKSQTTYEELTQRQITFTLANLRKTGRIENLGTHGRGARWYIKESDAQQD